MIAAATEKTQEVTTECLRSTDSELLKYIAYITNMEHIVKQHSFYTDKPQNQSLLSHCIY
jgi:hypothetical protein